jgi:hypothetical protein
MQTVQIAAPFSGTDKTNFPVIDFTDVYGRSGLGMIRQLLCSVTACSVIIAMSGCVAALTDDGGRHLHDQWNQMVAASKAGGWENSPGRKSDFIYAGIAAKDYEYENYKRLIRRGVSFGGLGTEATTIGLNTAATLVTGGTTKLLSGIAGGVTGVSASFNKNVLFDQSITTFIGKMDALRATKLKEIQDKLNNPQHIYSYMEAFRDVQDYGYQGTLDAAVASVGAQSGVEKAAAEGKITPNPSPTP